MSPKYEGIRVLIRGCQTSFLSPKLREWIFMIVNHHTIPGKLQLSDINWEKPMNSSITFFCDAKFLFCVVTYLWERDLRHLPNTEMQSRVTSSQAAF